MASFSKLSLAKLQTCEKSLQTLFLEVIKTFDCQILEGHRGKVEQDRAFAKGNSEKKWPNGNHNSFPSKAVDVIPYPGDWEDRERMSYFAGYVKGLAYSMGIKLRWGNDWDMDTQVKDNQFDDLVHFELA